jgi:hypothetical protein
MITRNGVWGADMSQEDQGHDRDRYRRLLAEATDESKRLAFIELLIAEGARDKLVRERIGRLGLSRPVERLHNQNSVSAFPLPSANEGGEVG